MTHEKRRYSAEEMEVMAKTLHYSGTDEFSDEAAHMLAQASSTEDHVIGLREERDAYKAVLDKFMIQWESDIQFYNGLNGHDLGTWADLFREALSKFRGES